MTKSIGCGLLAMVVSASVALASGGGDGDKKKDDLYQGGNALSWKPGSGITVDGGDAFYLNLKNLLQVQWAFTSNENAADTNNFTIRRARTILSGHVFDKNISYKLQLAGEDTGANLKDGWAQFDFMHDEGGTIGVRVGQSKTGFGLEATGTASSLFFVERSAASRTFADVRTRGAWVYGSHNENKLRWNAGAQNGDVANGANGVVEVGEETNNADNSLNFIANVSFDPMGDFMGGKTNEGMKQGDLGEGTKDLLGTIGAGICIGNNQDGITPQRLQSTSININTAWRANNLFALGEVFLRTDDPQSVGAKENSMGWYAQGCYVLPKSGDSPMEWGLGLRLAMIDTDNTSQYLTGINGSGGFKTTEVSAVVDAFYHGHAAKTQVEYTWQKVDIDAGGDSNNHIIRIQFNLQF